MDGQEILIRLLGLCFAVKIFHYRTKIYGRHKAADGFFEKFLNKADKYLEVYQGKLNKRIEFQDSKLDVSLPVLTDENIIGYMEQEAKWMTGNLGGADGQSAPELENIRDELVEITNKFKYLLTFQ